MKLRFATVVLSALMVLAVPAAAQAAPVCAKYANATTGSDSLGSGTAGSPYATISKVLDSIGSGEAGCLTGTFSGPVDIITPGRTLMSASQAQPATIAGYVYIHDNGGGTTLMGLRLDQTSVNDRPGLRIENDGVSLIGNEIFNDTLACVFVGPTALLAADNTRIEGNRLHNCGTYAIQIDHGAGNVVTDNYFFDNTGNVIDLFETSTGTQVRNNVIDDGSVGVKFAGVTSGATVTQNVITSQVDSTIAADPATTGTGNSVSGNCVAEAVPASTAYDGEASNTISTSPYGTDFTITATDCFGKGPNPLAATTPATSVTRSTATLNGDLNPHWHSATFFFEWGTDPTLATKSTTTSSNATNWVPVPVSGTLDGLKGGTTYYFRLVATNSSGGRSEGAIESFTTQPPLDRDGDGVPDDTDKCPDAPRGSIDANGDGCADDGDGDGVADAVDACPTVPRGTPDADGNGCPDDRDGDGVTDATDRCPSVARGTIDVDVDGCPDDTDRDGITDEADKCVAVARGAIDANSDGCPDDTDGDKVPDADDECPNRKAGPFDVEGDGCPNPAPQVAVGPLTENHRFFTSGGRRTAILFDSVKVRLDQGRTVVRLVCVRRCALKQTIRRSKRGTVALKKLRGRRLALGTVFDVRVTARGIAGVAIRVTVGRTGAVSIRRLCIPVGKTRPGRRASC